MLRVLSAAVFDPHTVNASLLSSGLAQTPAYPALVVYAVVFTICPASVGTAVPVSCYLHIVLLLGVIERSFVMCGTPSQQIDHRRVLHSWQAVVHKSGFERETLPPLAAGSFPENAAMSFNSTWLTQEPPILIHVETVIMVCTLLGTIAYGTFSGVLSLIYHGLIVLSGCNIAVYLSTMHAIWTSPVKRHLWLSTIFTTGIFAFSTLFLVWDVTAIQYAFVEYRNFPGGPAAFYPIMASLEGSRYDFGNFSAVIISWSSDAMLVSGIICDITGRD
jgi:hypothetical protein